MQCLQQVAVPVGIDITAYDSGRPCEVWPDLKGEGVALSRFELFSVRHLFPAKFAKSFEVWPLQADFLQQEGHLSQVGHKAIE